MVEKKETKENKGLKNFDLESVLLNPRVTEKSTLASEKNVYVFDVANKANKFKVAEAIKFLYKVTPVKVNLVTIPAKRIVYRGKKGVKSGGKKAYIYLKAEDKINIT
jgi:large subunit ribosomal protein L23